MKYPGRIVKVGDRDGRVVGALKRRLNEVVRGDSASRLDPDDPTFGPKMKRVVKLFQSRNVDGEGRPLKQNGEVGSLTWAAL